MLEPDVALHRRITYARGVAGEVNLEVVEGPDAGKQITLDRPIVIGRSPEADLVLEDGEVSGMHLRVTPAPDGSATIEDLDSTNGVHVDGEKVQGAVPLQPGARISIGPFTLIYQRGSVEDLAEAEEAEREQARAVSYIQALLPPPLPSW